jgi:hypothetical protein
VARAKEYFTAQGGTLAKVLFGLTAWAIMFGSKILILEVVQLIFEDDVDLGGFLNVMTLTVAMMVARRMSTAIFTRLGRRHGQSFEPTAVRGDS